MKNTLKYLFAMTMAAAGMSANAASGVIELDSVFEEIKRLRINSRTALSVDFLLYEIQSIII